MRKTKVICTIGPASDNEATLRKLVEEGMAVARMNFSHGTHEEHKKKFDLVKKVRADLSRHRDRLLRVPVVIAQLGFLFSEFESHEYIPNFVQNSPSNVNSCLTTCSAFSYSVMLSSSFSVSPSLFAIRIRLIIW